MYSKILLTGAVLAGLAAADTAVTDSSVSEAIPASVTAAGIDLLDASRKFPRSGHSIRGSPRFRHTSLLGRCGCIRTCLCPQPCELESIPYVRRLYFDTIHYTHFTDQDLRRRAGTGNLTIHRHVRVFTLVVHTALKFVYSI